MLKVNTYVLGPVATNSYLVADSQTGDAVVIDPAWDGYVLAQAAEEQGLQINQIWLTHAHFDHLAGVAELIQDLNPKPSIALHADDLPLWQARGGADFFGMRIDPGPRPNISVSSSQILYLGNLEFEVRHAPGHTRGHVIYYCVAAKVAFCGDVIFEGSIGRTDLPGGDYQTLIESIKSQVLSLPDETRLLCGHGPETTVAHERTHNPFLI